MTPPPVAQPIRLVVTGCCGRMGSLILEEASLNRDRFSVVGALEQAGHPRMGQPLETAPEVRIQSALKPLLAQADLVVEFTTPEATLEHARLSAESQVPILIGTTGFSPEQLEELKRRAQKTRIFWSPNMSIGIVIVRKEIHHLFEHLRTLGWDRTARIQISETHHAQKKDRPSGTAKLLAEEIRKVAQRTIPDEDIEVKREGQVVGAHSITWEFGAERILLQHEALDRTVFAQGALLVARHFLKLWSEPGWYGMDDFLGALARFPQRVGV